jgi:CRISPR/Cas system CSM-associated protein Csm3 (group 7 of RAMP superfamily)
MAESEKGKTKTRDRHRYLSERILVTGQLVLTRPAHFGNGDADELTDLPLLVDEVDGRALLTGASLAGALRNYLREREWGYEEAMASRDRRAAYQQEQVASENELLATKLFGGHRGDEQGDQSPLIVDDALSTTQGRPAIELRDGVAIDAATRTAAEDKKYDFELLQAGTAFDLRFELLLDDQAAKNKKLLQALALALRGLGKGEIRLGARKQRGFGRCEVAQWTVTRYRLHQTDELLAWLAADHPDWVADRLKTKPVMISGSDIAALLGVAASEIEREEDRRESFEIEAEFALDGSLLVRAGFDEQDRGPDTVHLHTHDHRHNKSRAVLPGTSLAGAIRQRAQRIANTLAGQDKEARKGVQALIDEMFGPAEIKGGEQARASRVIVNEEFIEGGQSLVQTRIKIDRFTQGTIETALLEEAPHFGGTIKLKLHLNLIPNGRTQAEIGLLLLVLKDLWLGDLPLGGASNVGRGRLCGQKATLTWRQLGRASHPIVLEKQLSLSAEEAKTLEDCVSALWSVLVPKKKTEDEQ